MMHSESVEVQEVREIGHKEAGESISIPILWMEIIDVFQKEGNKCQDQEKLNM